MSSSTTHAHTIEHTNGIDQPEYLSTPLDQVVAYTLLNSTHRLHFDHPVAFLNTVILVLLMRLPASQNETDDRQERGASRVALVGLKASFDAGDRVTTWGPDPLFWIELPPAMMAQPTGRSSPVSDQQLGHLALALNRAVHRECQKGIPVSGGPLIPPTMIALPPDDYENKPVINSYVERMAKIFRVSVGEVWPILAEEMIIPAENTYVGTPLVDARLWDPSYGDNLGEYAYLGGSLGRAVYNPARKVANIDFMEPDHVIHAMRRSLVSDLAAGCTDGDLYEAAERPAYPLFLSKISKIGVFRLGRDGVEDGVIELAGQGQRVRLPMERQVPTTSKRRATIQCEPAATT